MAISNGDIILLHGHDRSQHSIRSNDYCNAVDKYRVLQLDESRKRTKSSFRSVLWNHHEVNSRNIFTVAFCKKEIQTNWIRIHITHSLFNTTRPFK